MSFRPKNGELHLDVRFSRGFGRKCRVKILKPSRFCHDFKTTEEITFENALEFFLGVSSIDMISFLESYVVDLQLWNKHSRGCCRLSNFNDESSLVSSLRDAMSNMEHKPLAYLVFSLD